MKYSIFFLAASVGILAACSGFEKDIPVEVIDDVEITKVVFNVPPVIDDDAVETKASAIPLSDYNVSFAWEETDRIGIFPNKGSQIYFEPEDGVGTGSASFDGGGWALKSNANYISYYPFVADFDLDRNAIPISFTGQKQKGTYGPFNGERWVLATESTTSQNGKLTFEYNILNTIINVIATLPAGTYTSASLNIAEPLFVEEGTFSLDEQKITGTTFSKKLEIELEDFTLTSTSTVPIYFMAAPVDLTGKEIKVTVAKDDGSSYSCVKTPSGAYNPGRRRGLTCDQMKKDAEIINFADPEVKRLCVENWDTDGDGELDMDEAAAVTDLGNVFANNSLITTFDELQYFTGLTSIGGSEYVDDSFIYNGFYGCYNLTSVILPNTVTTLQRYAQCPGKALSFPNSVTRIEAYALRISEPSFIVPNQTLEMAEFAGSSNAITSLTLLGKIRFVSTNGERGGVFNGYNMKSLHLGDSFDFETTCSGDVSLYSFRMALFGMVGPSFEMIEVSGDNTKFDSRNDCNAVIETDSNTLLLGSSNTVIPYSVTSIAPYAFAFIRGLTSIEMPESITTIGEGALWCDDITEIIFKSTTPPELSTGVFPYTPAEVEYYSQSDPYSQYYHLITIYVPAGSVDAYKTADGWNEYADWIRSVEEYVVPDPGDDGND